MSNGVSNAATSPKFKAGDVIQGKNVPNIFRHVLTVGPTHYEVTDAFSQGETSTYSDVYRHGIIENNYQLTQDPIDILIEAVSDV